MQQISDYLFMGSLIVLVVTLLFKGLGSMGASNATGNLDLQMQQNHKSDLVKQDSIISKIYKSYFVWISITGIVISIVISKV
ncbi:hypothetical protein A8709_06595 [Paenibacillus pectinilyticus]|uniref:Uncharacterized protein n=1 Tax=Paenibacillus pectinilyticus TaxID=512399 RepID=A0A1C0ZTC8_9BACL|nr:hypothetical protein [Paenibacillus pectinilyticus]OCT11336.1 hypothetical protein A8709_06595 [Paenibacillus pectinilyticus]